MCDTYRLSFTHWTGRQVQNELVSLGIEVLRYKKGLLFADSFHKSGVMEQMRLMGALPPARCSAARLAPPVCLGPRSPGDSVDYISTSLIPHLSHEARRKLLLGY